MLWYKPGYKQEKEQNIQITSTSEKTQNILWLATLSTLAYKLTPPHGNLGYRNTNQHPPH